MSTAMAMEKEKELFLRVTAIRRELAQRSLLSFTTYTKPDYKAGWVHQDLCRRLDAFLENVALKKSPRLMFFMPPRHGKSELVSRRLPAFAFGKNPDLNFIASSYAADLSGSLNRDVQRIIDDEAYRELFPDTSLSGRAIRSVAPKGAYLRNTDTFEIVGHKGRYRSAGVGGGITGLGADIWVIDDPVKDSEEAGSPTHRNKVWEWYLSTGYTRVEAGGGILLCMTRWHEDDLAGRLLAAAESGGDQWEVVKYSAISEQDETYRKAGEALHPERWSLKRLEKIKAALTAEMGSRYWAALFQQRPSPDEGNVLKRHWFRYYNWKNLPETFDEVVQSWDCAFKNSADGSFVVGQVWGRLGANKYLLDQTRARLTFTQTLGAIRVLSEKWPNAQRKYIEDKANGPAIINTLKDEISGIIPINPEGSKIARASAVSGDIESGNVYLPEPFIASWVNDFVEECVSFPNAANDDQVDAMSQALRKFAHSSFNDYGNISLDDSLTMSRPSPHYIS